MRRTTHAGYPTYPGYRFLRFVDAPADPDNPAPAGGTPAPAAPADLTPKADPAPDGEKADGLPDDPEALKAEIAKLRKENARDRTDAKTKAAEDARNEMLETFAKAFGIEGAVEEVTVESLQEKLTESTSKLTAAETRADIAEAKLAVFQAATTANADASLLLDSAKFQATLADVDITDSAAVTKAITDWVKANPKFAATQVVGASTIEHPGGTGEGAITKERFGSMSIAEKTKLRRDNPAAYTQLVGK